MTTLAEQVAANSAAIANIDSFYLLTVGCLVFFMQAGFALLEAGSVRQKNAKNILLKNLLDASFGALIWYAWGYGASYGTGSAGTNGFIGVALDDAPDFFLKGWPAAPNSGTTTYALWFFQYVFAAAAATIVSGAVAERCQLSAYLIYTLAITGFIYPVMVHMTWSAEGALSGAFNGVYNNTIVGGNLDFAGSGVVHMTGGILALCGAIMIGPRMGRFDANGKPVPMPGHSSVLQVLGTFILWLGWYGFNPGSTLAISPSGYGTQMSRVAVTTTISAATGGIVVVFLDRIFSKTFDVTMVCNGILAGLVSITAPCACVYPWAALCIGFMGGFVYYASSKLLLKLKVDDPLDAFAVHGACGAWGVWSVGWFASPNYVYYAWQDSEEFPLPQPWICNGAEVYTDCFRGAFYGGGSTLAAQSVALVIEILWVLGTGMILFLLLRILKILRVSAEVEKEGLDISKHGGAAYPEHGRA